VRHRVGFFLKEKIMQETLIVIGVVVGIPITLVMVSAMVVVWSHAILITAQAYVNSKELLAKAKLTALPEAETKEPEVGAGPEPQPVKHFNCDGSTKKQLEKLARFVQGYGNCPACRIAAAEFLKGS
jgi:hypothetical protein